MIRIVIADDHTIMREGLKRILDGAPDIDIVGEAVDAYGRCGERSGDPPVDADRDDCLGHGTHGCTAGTNTWTVVAVDRSGAPAGGSDHAALHSPVTTGFRPGELPPILAALVQTPGQIDPQAAMAFFLVGAVHMALMVMVLKVAGTMVAGWRLPFSAGRDRKSESSHSSTQSSTEAALAQEAAPGERAAALVNLVVSRLVDAEREQIGLLKAFGYGDRAAPVSAPRRAGDPARVVASADRIRDEAVRPRRQRLQRRLRLVEPSVHGATRDAVVREGLGSLLAMTGDFGAILQAGGRAVQRHAAHHRRPGGEHHGEGGTTPGAGEHDAPQRAGGPRRAVEVGAAHRPRSGRVVATGIGGGTLSRARGAGSR